MEAPGRCPLSDPTRAWAGSHTGPSPRLALGVVLPFSLHACGSALVYEGRWAVYLLNLANKCHSAKASGHPLAFASSILLGRAPGRQWGGERLGIVLLVVV